MQSLTQWFVTEAIPAFGRTLVHSLWQGLAAAVLAGLVILGTRKASAAKRYTGLVVIYALFVMTVAVTFFSEIGSPATTTHPVVSDGAPPETVVIESGATNGALDENFGSNLLGIVDRNATLLVGLWALLFSAQLTRMALGLRSVQRIRDRGTHTVTGEWKEWTTKMSFRLGIRQTVRLLQSETITVPVALGILKPVVLVPIGLMTQLSSQQVEAVLLHELAHIRRKDYLVNLLQSFADAVFFFNPAVRWISARIREEREACCDRIVVQYTGNKKDYIEALVSFGQLPLSPSCAMAIGGNRAHLLNRVKTIITRENSRLTAREQVLLMAGVILMTLGVFAFKPKEGNRGKETASEKERPGPTRKIVSTGQTETGTPAESFFASRPVADTVPKKLTGPVKWKNLSTNINDDGEGKMTQVIGTQEDGTVYRMRKVNGEMVSLSVNGREIARENYPQYHSVIESMEQARKKWATEAEKNHRQQTLQLKQEQKNLYRQQESLQQNEEALQRHLSGIDREKMVYTADSANLNEHELNLYHQIANLLNKQQHAYAPHKTRLGSHPTLQAIIADLRANDLADDETRLSFTLTATELVVNGKPANKEVFETFRKKYIKSSGDSFQYSRDGGTTTTTIIIQ